ncbi:amino acid adenylation domain-containing protein [Butyrivibrio sp. YAB3001]|uniref:amino acid adenylation domain-containing protein n=1 Tax=Butyrivibrio sp. YAB3001 TaxID=1520812 RepID=UPI0008F62700|nr:amino acid adenylation domain-containing protein [Butyrivibrio sp. YAB3001]SFB96256.1 amino acid adenylation domain-containing protein [Butyrivibrio sp. YAB3001]
MNEYNVLSFLESSAEKHPDRVAFKDKDEAIDYNNLLTRSQKIAFVIRKNANLELFEKNKPVAVFIDRNIRSLQLFLAVVYSGNFYVPIDPTLPIDRIQAMLDTLQPVCCISATKRKLPVEADSFDSLLEQSEEIGDDYLESIKKIREFAIDTDPVYAIFTSGTTGVPKSVIVSHRSVIDLVHRFAESFPFPELPVFANQAPFDFDVSVKDIYNSLNLGGTVVIVPKSYFVMPAALFPYLEENNVNVLIWAVSALRIVQNFKLFDACVPDSISLVMFSGEIMPVKCLNYLMDYWKDATFVNLYGPTEITCNCSSYIIKDRLNDTDSIPIGKSFANTEMLLINPDTMQRIRKAGEKGEICVKGSCLALGYYRNSQQTEKAFVQDPEVTAYQDLMYRTGDIGYYDESGNFYYAGRSDHQIKHMGHRIEMGEIETVVNALDEIKMACAVYKESKEMIYLFYSAEAECDDIIIKQIRKYLPSYMLPNKFVYLHTLPMNAHDKIDRKKLAELEDI